MRAKRKRVTLIGLLQAAAILTVLFSVATSFDVANRSIELFSHFRPQYLAISLLLLVVFAVQRNPVYAIAMLIVTVLNASFVLPWYYGRENNPGAAHIKLLHANVLSKNDDYARLLELIVAEKPDIIFLQEFSPEWQEATTSLHIDYPFNYLEAREGNFGIAMFSRVALESIRHVDSPPMGYPTIIATLSVTGKALTIISTHPTIPVAPRLYEARNEQLKSVAELVEQAHGAVILTGDFNASLWGRQYRILEKNTGLRNTRRGFGILPTWPTFMPIAMIPIDHALVSDEIRVVDVRTGPRIGSDHLPLIVDIAIDD